MDKTNGISITINIIGNVMTVNVIIMLIIISSMLSMVSKWLVQRLEDMEIRGQEETIQTTALLRSARNTKKSPGDLRRLAVTQAPVENHQLTLVRKTLKGEK